jgi:tetratricopeptide (TPR) repeat protein
MKKNTFLLFSLIIFIGTPTFALASKKKKSNGTHLLMVTGPEEYWKSMGKIAIDASAKLIKDGAIISIPFVESQEEVPTAEFNKTFKKVYKKGVKYYKKGKYRRSIKTLKKAIKQFNNMVNKYGLTYMLRRRLALSHLYIGAGQLLDAQTKKAKGSFRFANAIYPGYPLPKSAFSNDSAKNAFVKSIEAPGFGTSTLIVNSTVSGFVFVDGNLVGISPLIVQNIHSGTHVVTWARIGYKPIFSQVTIEDEMKGVTSFSPILNTNKKLGNQLKKINNSLRRGKDAQSEMANISTESRVDNILVFRSSATVTEISWYNGTTKGWQKRVRRQNVVPGNMMANIWKLLLTPKPILDLGVVSSTVSKCFTDTDCPSGTCVGGSCMSSEPFYKTWWFWTATIAGAALLGGGGYMLFQIQNRPVFEFSTP